MVGKVLKSAVANAVNNHDLDEDKLYVKACWADEGITMKRLSSAYHRDCQSRMMPTRMPIGLTFMVGHKLGEFVPTRKYTGHASDDKKGRK